MSDAVNMQADIANVSLASLGGFSTILTALSADDVQPIAMVQLQNLGAAFPVTGPVSVKAPDYLRRCNSSRLERLGILVGWRKGDTASLMAQSAGGQAIALLAACLCNICTDSVGDVFYAVSKGLLPRSACPCSPRVLDRAAHVLAHKLALIKFGTIIAKQVCRIHEAYQQLQRKVPMNILEELSVVWIAEMLVNVSRALRECDKVVRVRGCCGMGYILALIVTLFADDSVVMIEGVVIHRGSHSSSIVVEIMAHLENHPLQLHLMQNVDTLAEIFHSSRDEDHRIQTQPLPIGADFAWKGLISALLQTILQRWNLVCSSELIRAVGVCALSAADITYFGENDSIRFPAISILGKQYHAICHQRCEAVLGTPLPHTWPSYPIAFKQLEDIIIPLILTRPDGSFHELEWTRDCIRRGEVGFTGQIMDCIWLAFATLFVNAHEDATWRHFDFGDDEGISTRPECWGNPEKLFFMCKPNLVWKQLTPNWGRRTVAASDRKCTLVPSQCFTIGHEDVHYYRGVELLDGPLIYNERYHDTLMNVDLSSEPKQQESLRRPSEPSNPILPSAYGVHSDLSMGITESIDGLILHPTVTISGQRFTACLASCLKGSFQLAKTTSCEHPRKTPLKEKYVQLVSTTSVRRPDIGHTVSIVQTAGNPTAQFLALSGRPSILCSNCCLNCAYEQALSRKLMKIIVA
ncbi:hypothetical protein BDV38DRAFT_88244 [Aspergillus pseudotamarii]|uniref:Uncharacterized protein n=1 Tax=Aspergillus pseudotamarii TaxID=132259 RepID=A0A5N6SRI8_ASPPS|nr:uncharacterized protein BDV38DRAFT_88244 [Aspergillus pseudotamarii]KAE8137296.1 hypothetical protein BDV38DRAFT_88244 [Aspergillus pseudotamarii]